MAAIVCHGLQSCLESQLVESRTTLRLSLPFSKTLTPPPQPLDLNFKSTFWDSNTKTQYSEETSTKSDALHDKGGWSFLQVLSNVCHGGPREQSEKESVYVHPQVKRSSLMLSDKSLELCTENLGNETGTDIVGNNIELLPSSSSEYGGAGDSPKREQTRAARQGLGGKKAKTQNFPPPLTTINGSESLRVRTHRENGRLVIEAVRVTSSASCFKAERSNGRLRLCLLKNHTPSFDYEEVDTEENEEVESERNDGEEGTEEEAEEEEEEDEDGERDGLRVEQSERPRRCKEGENENNELLSWEPVWVATS